MLPIINPSQRHMVGDKSQPGFRPASVLPIFRAYWCCESAFAARSPAPNLLRVSPFFNVSNVLRGAAAFVLPCPAPLLRLDHHSGHRRPLLQLIRAARADSPRHVASRTRCNI